MALANMLFPHALSIYSSNTFNRMKVHTKRGKAILYILLYEFEFEAVTDSFKKR